MALAAVLTSHSWIVAGSRERLGATGRRRRARGSRPRGRPALRRVRRAAVADARARSSSARSRPSTPPSRRRTRRYGPTKSRWTVGYLDTVRALLAGRFADAEAAVERGREAARETTSPQALAESAFVRLLSCVRIVQGRLTEYESAREAMAQGITNLPPTFFVVRAHAARERHDRDGARAAFERAISKRLLEYPRGPTWLISLTWAADICAWLDDGPRARRLLDLLAPFSDVMTWQYGPVGRVVGLLAAGARTAGRGRATAARRSCALRAHGRTSLPRHGPTRPRRAVAPIPRGPPAPRPGARCRRRARHPRPRQAGNRPVGICGLEGPQGTPLRRPLALVRPALGTAVRDH